MSSLNGLQWDSENGRLHYNGVFRCNPTVLDTWCRKQPAFQIIRKHSTNPSKVDPVVWWNAQAILYGIRPAWTSLDKIVHKFRSYVGSRPLSVPKHIRKLELQYSSQQSTQIPNLSRLLPHSSSLNTAVFPSMTGTWGTSRRPSGESDHTSLPSNTRESTRALPSSGPESIKQGTATIKTESPAGRPLKRKAEFDLEGPSRRPTPAFSAFSQWRPSLATEDDELNSSPEQRRFTTAASPGGESTRTGMSALVRFPSVFRSTEGLSDEESDALAGARTYRSDPINGSAHVDKPILAERITASNQSDTRGMASSSSHAAFVTTSLTPTSASATHSNALFGGSAKRFIYFGEEDGWSVSCQCFSYSENRGFLICGYPKSASKQWIRPLARASRWTRDEDEQPLIFYYSQLLHRGLPLTTSKEVAKWRLTTPTQVSQEALVELDTFKTELFIYLSENIRGLKSGELKATGFGPAIMIDTATEVQTWMIEKPSSLLLDCTPYDTVMRAWLTIRSKLPLPTSTTATTQPLADLGDEPFPTKCPGCDRKYRLCTCNFCNACGELASDCECQRCDECGLRIESCSCGYCRLCQTKYNIKQRIYCSCFCPTCGYLYLQDFLSPLDNPGEFVSLNPSVCKCPLSTREAEILGSRLMREREDRRKAQAQKSKDKDIQGRMISWMQENQHDDFVMETASATRDFNPCGTYELVVDSHGCQDVLRYEIVISYDGDSLWGRFRLGDVHGLFRTGAIGDSSLMKTPTESIPCKTAVQWAGSGWQFDVQPEETGVTFHNILFIGNGLILVDTSSLRNRTEEGCGLNSLVFGIRSSDYCEDVAALQDSWSAVHTECCDCDTKTSEHSQDINYEVYHPWRSPDREEGEDLDKRFTEVVVDRLVDRLCPSGLSAKDKAENSASTTSEELPSPERLRASAAE